MLILKLKEFKNIVCRLYKLRKLFSTFIFLVNLSSPVQIILNKELLGKDMDSSPTSWATGNTCNIRTWGVKHGQETDPGKKHVFALSF